MLNYGHSRTEEIIDRLIQVSNAAQSVLIVLCCLVGIAVGGTCFAVLADKNNAVVFGVIGILVGGMLGWQGGRFWSTIITGTVEWMAQSLIAQGETLEQLKKNSE